MAPDPACDHPMKCHIIPKGSCRIDAVDQLSNDQRLVKTLDYRCQEADNALINDNDQIVWVHESV
jgi:hypothetical protein